MPQVERKHRAVRWTEEMIAIQSVNPHYGEGAAGEKELSHYIESLCKEEGVHVYRQRVLPDRDNLIIEVRTGRPDKTLLFEAHMDTVSLGNMLNPLTPIVRDGRLHGRGACDTKSSLAAMLHAVLESAKRADEMACDLVMVAAVDEEHEYRGLSKWMELNMPAAGAVVGEPTNNRIVIAHKGCARFKLSTFGKAAHSSIPEEGVNAIYAMAKMIQFIEEQEAAELAAVTHPLCGSPTIVVSTIQGGKQINIVPEYCEIEVDRRMIPGEDCGEVLEALKRKLETYAKERGIKVQMETLLEDYALNTPADAAVVRSAQQTALQLGMNAEPIGVSYGSDASKLQQVARIPSIVFGPGSIAQAHSSDEWVPVHEIEQAADFLLQLALNFGKEREI